MATVPVPVTPSAARDRAPVRLALRGPDVGRVSPSCRSGCAVLFVGLFAGDIVSINGTPAPERRLRFRRSSSVAFFALIATVSLARWGFGSRRAERKEDGAS